MMVLLVKGRPGRDSQAQATRGTFVKVPAWAPGRGATAVPVAFPHAVSRLVLLRSRKLFIVKITDRASHV